MSNIKMWSTVEGFNILTHMMKSKLKRKGHSSFILTSILKQLKNNSQAVKDPKRVLMREKKEEARSRDNKERRREEKKSVGRTEGGVSSPQCWPVSFEVITGWLGTFKAGQWTSHARPHTFRPVSRCGDVARLDLHTHTNTCTDTEQTHKYVGMHTPTWRRLLGHAGTHIPGHDILNDYLPCLQKQRLRCLCRYCWGRNEKKKKSTWTVAGAFLKSHDFDWQHWAPERKLECLDFCGKHKRTERVE